MKLFTIGLIAGTAFAEPNLRPTDRKLSGGETITVVDNTLTIDDIDYDDLNTIAGVKALALAFKTQEENRLEQCTTDLNTYDSDKIAYDWATAKKAFEDYETAKNKYDLCQEWDAYEDCAADAEVVQNAEAELDSQTASRRRLDITVDHLDAALTYLGSGMTTCPAQPTLTKPSDCPASEPSTVNDPGDWDTANGAEPDYSGTLTQPQAPTGTGCETSCNNAPTDPTDPQNSCSVRKPCIAEKVCGIKRVILALDPGHTFN